MNRKPGFPTSSSSITLPQFSKDDGSCAPTDPELHYKKRQQLISFGHNQWGFDNWNWVVSKQELDFVDFSNGKFCAGVVAFVSVTVKSLGIHREDIGYATSVATQKGSAIHNARKSSVTNALRETLLGFGGNIAMQLMEQLESTKNEVLPSVNDKDTTDKNIKNTAAPESSIETRNATSNINRKDSVESVGSLEGNQNKRDGRSPPKPNQPTGSSAPFVATPGNPPQTMNQGSLADKSNFPANQTNVNRFVGMPVKMVSPAVAAVPPVSVPPPPAVPPPAPGVSYVVQRVMPPLYSAQCGTPPPPQMYHNTFYTEFPPWAMSYDNNYDRQHGNVNYNFNMPPKNFMMNSRQNPECPQMCDSRLGVVRSSEGDPAAHSYMSHHPVNISNPWIKPSIFYDGFWTEQKVKKWASEQVEKAIPVEKGNYPIPANNIQNQMCHSKV